MRPEDVHIIHGRDSRRVCGERGRANDSPRAGVRGHRPRRRADDGLADERRRLVQPPLFAVDADRSRQRRELERRLAHSLARLRARRAVLRRSAAARARGRHLRRDGRERRVRRQRRERRDPLGVPREPRSREQRRLLRLDEPRRRVWATARSTSASSTASSSRSISGRAASRGPCRPSAGKKASRSRAPRSTSTASSTRASPAASAASAAASKRSTRATASSSGRSTRFRGPARSGTTRGRRTTRSGWTAARPCGTRRPSIPSSGSSTSRPAIPGPTTTARFALGDNLFSTSVVAVDAKTGAYRWHFQEVHHDIWDYDAAAPVTLFDIELNGVTRKGLAHAGKTGWVYIARPHGRHAARRHRRAACAARAAARHGSDAAVPARRRVHSAADRHRARGHDARQRRQDLHAVLDDARAHEARPAGRRELAAELVRSRERLPICVRGRSHLVVPRAGGHGRAASRGRRATSRAASAAST